MTFTATLRTAVAAALLVTFAAPSFAATQDSMILRGSVDSILEVDLQPEAIASNLDLTAEANDLLVAQVFERANDPDGYTITFSSANRGVLKGAQGNNSDVQAYNLTYDDQQNFSLSGGDFTIHHNGRTGAEGVTRSLKISYPLTWLAADSYEDTVTVTIAAL
jgi:hypothetical protein